MQGGTVVTEMGNGRPVDPFSRKWLLIVIASMLPVYLLFVLLGQPGRGWAAAIALAFGMTAIRASWDLSRHAWFWLVAGAVAALHVVLIFLVPWTEKSYPGYTLLSLGLLDYFFFYGCFRLAAKVFSG